MEEITRNLLLLCLNSKKSRPYIDCNTRKDQGSSSKDYKAKRVSEN